MLQHSSKEKGLVSNAIQPCTKRMMRVHLLSPIAAFQDIQIWIDMEKGVVRFHLAPGDDGRRTGANRQP
jgi:hypothetical protein